VRRRAGGGNIGLPPATGVERLFDMETRDHISLRLDGNVERRRPVQIMVDGETIQAYEGESLAAA
jgi:hypothetical protein